MIRFSAPAEGKSISLVATWLDAAILACGLAVSAWLLQLVLATGSIHWRMEWDLVAVIALQLLPLGPTLLGTPRLAWRLRPAQWSMGQWLWPGALLTSVAWLIVWLENGRLLGPVAKLICGPIALLLTPMLGLVALVSLVLSLRHPAQYGYTHWLGLLWASLGIAGCLWFVLILLPLKF